MRTRTLDVSRHKLATLVRDERKPLLYGAGLGESGRREALGEIDGDVAIVLVMRTHQDQDVIPALEQASRDIAATARKQPYALPISG